MSEFELLIALSAEIAAHRVALANLAGEEETNQEMADPCKTIALPFVPRQIIDGKQVSARTATKFNSDRSGESCR